REGSGEIQAWLKLAGLEKTSPTRDLEALGHAAQSTAEILVWVDAADRCPESLPTDLQVRLAQTLDEMASVLQHGGYPVEVALDEPARDVPLAPGPSRIWSNLRSLVVHFAESPSAEPAPTEPSKSTAKPKSGFLLPDAFTNPEHVHYALKTTAAAMFCYWLYT